MAAPASRSFAADPTTDLAANSAHHLVADVERCRQHLGVTRWLRLVARRLAGIPSVLLPGRLDLSSPLETAWQLARAWPGAELVVVEDAGHTGSPRVGELLRRAYRDVADRSTPRSTTT